MKIKFKKLHENAVPPSYSKPGDAGLDLTSVSSQYVEQHAYQEHSTGIAVEIPSGYVGLVFPRSSISDKSVTLGNAVAVIDSNYRGEIKLRFKIDANAALDFVATALDQKDFAENYKSKPYEIGDKIGQLIIIPYPTIDLEEVEELSDSVRGNKGFGSSGK